MQIQTKQYQAMWEQMNSQLDEKQRRLFAASMAQTIGHGGLEAVHKITGLAINTIKAGRRENAEATAVEKGKVRRTGGGRKQVEQKYDSLHEKVKRIIDDSTYGNPENPLSYTTMSLRKISNELKASGNIEANHTTVSRILEELEYSKQANRKMLQLGEQHPDRNGQFEYINTVARLFIESGEPVISVDTKKKENIGNFKNNGREYRHKNDPRSVLDHDFPIEELGKLSPYGVFCRNNNTAFVNAGTDHDTAEFAVESIAKWWEIVGGGTFPDARRLFITCDSGGSNGSRVRMWKYQLQQLTDRIKLDIYVSHFPPGTSKWNKIEHQLFCYITKNWQGKPLVDIETAIKLISSTTTKEGLKVICRADYKKYELKRTVADEDFKKINILRLGDHGEWNYRISPR
jgi:hypothetical protein